MGAIVPRPRLVGQPLLNCAMNFPGVPSHRNETMKRCILCLAALSLAACGASGPLYLPGHQKAKSSVLRKEQNKTGPSSPAPAPAAPATSPADAPAPAPQQQPQPGTPDAGAAPKPADSTPPSNSDSTPPPQP